MTLAVGGFVPFTTIDYPGLLSAVVFCRGCPWRCCYCQNAHLQQLAGPTVEWESMLGFLRQRRQLLDAVVFSGGEPTMQPGLLNAVQQVKALGYKVALHTAAPCLDAFAAVLPELDWVGLDVKALPQDYEQITKTPGSGKNVLAAIELLLKSDKNFEVRTTAHRQFMSEESLLLLGHLLAQLGVRNYVVQRGRLNSDRAEGNVDSANMFFPRARQELSQLFDSFSVRV